MFQIESPKITSFLSRGAPRVVVKGALVALMGATLAGLGGCFAFEGLFLGPFPCDDSSHCPDNGECFDGTCVDEAGGSPCESDQECPEGQFCNTTDSVCGEGNVFEDNYVVENELDLQDLERFHKIEGVLLIGPDSRFDQTAVDRGIGDIVLPRLVSVSGIHVGNQSAVTLIDLPALERIGNDGLTVNLNDTLVEIDLPVLVDADNISISENPMLEEIRIDALVRLSGFGGGQLDIEENNALELVNFPALEFANFVSISDNGNMAPFVINVPNFAEAGLGFFVSSSASLQILELPRLTNVGGGFLVIDMASMASVEAPSLVSVEGNFNLSSNDGMTSFSFASLQSVQGDLDVTYNPLFDECVLLDFFDDVTVSGAIDISDNGACL